jgi:hypothetical protein
MKKVRRVLIVSVVILLLFSTSAFGAEYLFFGKPIKKIIKDYNGNNEIRLNPNATGDVDFIKTWYVSIRDHDDGDLVIEGCTEAYSTMEEVSVIVELQRKEGSSWKTVKSWSAKSYNKAEAYCIKAVTVPKGYYYRAVGTHYAEKGRQKEKQVSRTSSYFVE